MSASEVGQEITEHRHQAEERGQSTKHDRRITIVEAVLLSVVTILAAWSGFASAKWGTEAQLTLARASASRTEASRANLDAMEERNFDASTFNTWFTAFIAGNQGAMTIAEKRFRPEFQVAFEAWLLTDPATNPDAPPGPTFMKEYRAARPGAVSSLEKKAAALYKDGWGPVATSDEYVRTTVLLASVLFLVGISGHFRFAGARYGLIAIGSVILVVSIAIILTSPGPPA